MASFLLAMLGWCIPIIMLTCAMEVVSAGRRRHLPPGPWPLPVIGNFHSIAWSRAHRSLAHLAERYGPLMTIWLGRRVPTVVVSSPDTAREILHNADSEAARPWTPGAPRATPRTPSSTSRRATSGAPCGDSRRRSCSPRRGSTRGRRKCRSCRVSSPSTRRSEPVDVGHAAFVTTLELLSRTLYSVDLATDEIRRMVKDASRLATTPTISDVVPALAAADLQGARRKFGALIRYGHWLIDEQFARRRRGRDAGEPRKNDMMDVVIDKEQEWKEVGNPMNYDAVKGMFTEFFVAGTDTTSSTVEWVMAELLRHPESMKKEELKMVIGAKPAMEESDINDLPYLQAVVKETLRLHPAASMTFYRAMATTQVQGYTIPKGSNIIINLWSIHRKGDIWTDPEKFMPERFIAKDTSFWGKDFELIPFGAGRRICLGLPLAHRMVHLMVGSLLHHFDWSLSPEVEEKGIQMTEKFGIVVSMATPLKAIAKKCSE